MKENLNDLRAFLMVTQTGSFTKAGAQMGVLPSALSHAIRAIEERFIHDYPEVELELGNDTRFVDIVAERFDGYYLYYPNRRHHSPLLQALVAYLKETS